MGKIFGLSFDMLTLTKYRFIYMSHCAFLPPFTHSSPHPTPSFPRSPLFVCLSAADLGTGGCVVTRRSPEPLSISLVFFSTPPPPPSIPNKTHAPGLGCSLTLGSPGCDRRELLSPLGFAPGFMGWRAVLVVHKISSLISPGSPHPELHRSHLHPLECYGLFSEHVRTCSGRGLQPRASRPAVVDFVPPATAWKGPPQLWSVCLQAGPSVTGQQGLCIWDWWCWQLSSSAPWVTTITSRPPKQEDRDEVSAHVSFCLFLKVTSLGSSLSLETQCNISHVSSYYLWLIRAFLRSLECFYFFQPVLWGIACVEPVLLLLISTLLFKGKL